MSPYSTPVQAIKDVSPYFRKNKDMSLTFIGETLEVRIPRSFESKGGLVFDGDSVTTIGVCDLIFNNTHQAALNLLGSFTIIPSEISNMVYQGVEYVVLHLVTGDTFMTSTRIVQDTHVVYVLWSEFITAGKPIYTLDYNGLLSLFERAKELTGSGIGVSRSVYEGIIAHLSRDRNDVTKQYRHTDMKRPVRLIALSSISQATTSTIARLNGSYFRDEGLTSALRREVEDTHPFEQLLRGLPTTVGEGIDRGVT